MSSQWSLDEARCFDIVADVHRSVIFQLVLVGFLAGVALSSFLIVPSWAVWLTVAVGAVGILVRRPWFAALGFAVLAFSIGAWRTADAMSAPSVLWQLGGDRAAVELIGYVDGDFSPTKSGGQYPFRVMRVRTIAGEISVDDRVAVFGPDSLRPLYGQVLTLTGKLQRPKNSGDFDYASYLAKDGIHAVMYFPQYSVPLDWRPGWHTRARLAVVRRLHDLRGILADAITTAVSQPGAAYLTGILVGARGVISPGLKELFASTGTGHILAISGYNITIIVVGLATALAPLGRRRSFWMTNMGIVAFTVMVGASASVVRAAIMGILVLIARYAGRAAQSGTIILLSAAMMTAVNPLLLRWDVGFQLSFLALLGIVYLQPLIVIPLQRIVRWSWFAHTAATTAAASIAVLPLILYDFGQLAVYTLPVNLLVLPLVPLAMALGLATGVAGLVWPFAGQLIGQSAWLVSAVQLGVIKFFAGLPHASLSVSISPAALIAAYAAIATSLVLAYRKHHA